MAFYELRQYKIHPGKLKAWVALMEETIIPFQVSKGMVITGSYYGEEDETQYFWTRRFNDEGGAGGAVCRGLRERLLEERCCAANSGAYGPVSHTGYENRSDSEVGCSIDIVRYGQRSSSILHLIAISSASSSPAGEPRLKLRLAARGWYEQSECERKTAYVAPNSVGFSSADFPPQIVSG